MQALPQRYEKATAMLWEHDRYRNANRNANVYRYKVMLANVSGNGYGSDLITFGKFQRYVSVSLAVALRNAQTKVKIAVEVQYYCNLN